MIVMVNIVWGFGFLLLVSTVYHQIRQRIDLRDNPPPGELIKIGNDRMHIYGQGKGSPTLLFSCGGGFGFSLGNYYHTFSKLMKRTRVVVYDRFGFGWSDSTAKPRTLKQINQDLHELLHRSQERGPYVLVGHSLGATEVLQFAQRYPKLVTGVVMLDGVSPSFYQKNQGVFVTNFVTYVVASFLRFTGILRVLLKLHELKEVDIPEPEKRISKLSAMMMYNRIFSPNALQEILALQKGDELESKLGDMPLLVVAAENANMKKAMRQDWIDCQERLLALSTNSKRKLLKGTDHMFPIKQPEIVTEEISWFMDNMLSSQVPEEESRINEQSKAQNATTKKTTGD